MQTNRIKKIIKNNYIKYSFILIIGLFFGWLIFGGSSNIGHKVHSEDLHKDAEGQVWTCSMHPQIKQDKPGKCPICAMDLIPLKTSGGNSDELIDPAAIQMSKEAVALANIQTTVVSRQNPIKYIQLYGTIQADERLSQSQTSHVSGRIEKLLINFTGESVRQGQTIATIYSPELLSAQQELLEAAKMQDVVPGLVEAAREKLRLWKLSDDQIAKIETSTNISPLIDIRANTTGIVIDKKVSQGDYINQGNVLFDIANLTQVWAVFDVYEADLSFLKVGDELDYTLQALPGKTFAGKISFINPILDPTTRTAKVRVETANSGMQLKPEMYANAIIKAPLKQYNNEIVIPKSAVLWTGKRSIVYIKQPNIESSAFILHEIELGPSLGDSYIVIEGIDDGDEIVTNGAFTIDASAQLEGKRSMMNTEVLHSIRGHEGHDILGVNSKEILQNSSAKIDHTVLSVQGNCEMCKNRIEKVVKAISGVTSATWYSNSKQLHVNFELSKTSIDTISKAIAKVGHDTDKYKSEQTTYDALPDCCKYR